MSANRASRTLSAAAVLVLAVAGAASAGQYVIRPGDTLSGIAGRHGTTVGALAEANGIADPDRIVAGRELTIPGTPGAGHLAGDDTHTVRRGETLAGIAARHGTTLGALAEANGIADPDRIVAGRELTIPGTPPGGSAGATSGGTPDGPHTTHVVQPGETLAGIAARYGTTVEALAEANGIVDARRILAGARLLVGRAPVPPPAGLDATAGGGAHTVRRGETLAGIAARYGTTVGALAEANGIADPDRIVAGRTLTVPGSSWRCPVPGARFVNDWGLPRSGGRFHQGTDLFAPEGTPVLAPVNGVVRHGSSPRGGLQFRLAGDDGDVYLGVHLQRFGAGGRVGAGDVVGYVGATGNARGTEPHLHLEVHPDGAGPANPFPLLHRACR